MAAKRRVKTTKGRTGNGTHESVRRSQSARKRTGVAVVGAKAPRSRSASRPAKGRPAVRGESQRASRRGPEERDAMRALDALTATLDRTSSSITDVAAVLDRLAAVHVEQCLAGLADALTEEHLLRDLDTARAQLSSDEPLSAADRASLSRLQQALLGWFVQHLGLEPDRQAGAQLTVPAAKLGSFQIEGEGPREPGALVTLLVEAGGWRRKGKVLSRPLARIVT